MDLEQVVMGIIVNAGQARSLYYEGLNCAKSGDFTKAEECVKQAQSFISEAHKVQTQLISDDQGEGKVPMTLIMVHAQDHIMTAMLAGELIAELIALYQKMEEG
ncbi:PTS lactose/cellobiose transporter subunit IIA [Celerinatantimonas diazotrophica]|uniref:PTS system N,N'-diacetylchitobiose-specific EIIA component n=1 Tax=Celerinatantimonas diazotrophica TaxID=412034 RepID=A0A4R1K7H9_9GAMM|nr:PTS lactose/cellobiose transporter subunit IIA [Celerinatantimonas diazotrophica]TCK59019.1 PTS system N,N'-diacetylchitobiose-specific IIA component (Lac family) [Celerinatantimonas diazotrophica]CAG9297654.1 PTS system N,N'-diacetylchitobiose-specific EIIA component [Celerinatantimonas diazotrophica]